MTVVIPVVTNWDHAARCLEHLERERQTFALGVLAVSRLGPQVATSIAARFPWVRVMPVDADTTIPAMRALGIEQANAPVVAIIEDHVDVPPGWATRMHDLVVERGGVVAGPVGDGSHRFSSRAAFVCEYSGALPPVASGPRAGLPGNNTAYPARVLVPHRDLLVAGGWEDELHERLAEEGVSLWFDEGVEATHALELGALEYAGLRYHYSRAWAGRRRRGAPFARRVSSAAKSVALPPVLLARILGRAVGRSRYRGIAVMSLPLQVLFVVAWAAGEFVGNLAGPGHSLTKVR